MSSTAALSVPGIPLGDPVEHDRDAAGLLRRPRLSVGGGSWWTDSDTDSLRGGEAADEDEAASSSRAMSATSNVPAIAWLSVLTEPRFCSASKSISPSPVTPT